MRYIKETYCKGYEIILIIGYYSVFCTYQIMIFLYFVGLGHLLLVLCYLCNGVLGSEKYIIRETRQGNLQGLIQKARNGAEFHAFLGVPYAKPPVDDLRWESPIPAENWVGIKDVTSNPSLCMQEFVLNPENVIGTY